MKPIQVLISGILILAGLFGYLNLHAQDDTLTYVPVRGRIVDERTESPIIFANVYLSGTNIGTVSNSEGEFIVKIPLFIENKILVISSIGYMNREFSMEELSRGFNIIRMEASPIPIEEVTIINRDARDLVESALSKTRENYSPDPVMMRSFYRETIKQNRSYVSVSEAVLDGYKASYTSLTDMDRVKIYKGRKSRDVKKMDTIVVKLQGGPRTMFLLDIIKNPMELFDREVMEYYVYQMGGIVNIDDRKAYVINFDQVRQIEYPLYSGKLYIDVESLGFVGADFRINPDKLDQAALYLVRKKPPGLHIDLLNASYIVNFRYSRGLWYLSHARTELIMAIRWKKKLFRSTYTTVSEMAVTDIDYENIMKFRYRESSRRDDVFAEQVSDFEDPDFWGNNNIIQPEESIQEAIDRIGRRMKRQSR